MKILLAAPTYLPARRANTFQVMKMAQAVKLLGHDVCVLVPNPEDKIIPDWDSIAHHYGLHQRFDIEWTPVKPHLRSYDYGLEVTRYFSRFGAEILYTRLPQAAALASSLNIPTIFEVHDLPGGFLGPRLLRRFLKGRGACRLVVITQSLSDAITQRITPLPGYPFTVVEPDGVDLVRYEGVPRPIEARQSLRREKLPQLSVSQFTAGYTGHLYPGRGIDLILNIASLSPEINFLLVGGDPRAVSDLQDDISRRGLKNIILTGFVPNAELPCYQAACEVLMMPYQRNVAASSGGDIAHFLSPMKLFEYMACGRVILSSHLPVLDEVLNEHNAILLPPDDVHAWVAALQEIKNDHPRQVSLAEHARVDSLKYSWEARAERILRFDG
jgi:glycosyltransferase involved in cell wall biosynthesis